MVYFGDGRGGVMAEKAFDQEIRDQITKIQPLPFMIDVTDKRGTRGAALVSDIVCGDEVVVAYSTCDRQTLSFDAERERFEQHLNENSLLPSAEVGSEAVFRHTAYPEALIVAEPIAVSLRKFLTKSTRVFPLVLTRF